LASPFPEGETVLHGGGHGAGERRLVVVEGIIPGGHGVSAACLQVSQVAQRADDPAAQLLHDVCHISLAGWLDVDKPRLAARCSAIERLSGNLSVSLLRF
jgi:hypothetical protein